jgi:hypothetical protein
LTAYFALTGCYAANLTAMQPSPSFVNA